MINASVGVQYFTTYPKPLNIVGQLIQSRERSDRVALNIFNHADHKAHLTNATYIMGRLIQSRERSDWVALNILIRADHAGAIAPGSELVDPQY